MRARLGALRKTELLISRKGTKMSNSNKEYDREYSRRYRQAHPGYYAAYARKWRAKNKHVIKFARVFKVSLAEARKALRHALFIKLRK